MMSTRFLRSVMLSGTAFAVGLLVLTVPISHAQVPDQDRKSTV